MNETPLITQTAATSALQALQILRDPSGFSWSVVPILALVIHLYTIEMGERRWNSVITGLAVLGFDFVGEFINALILRFTGYAPLWSEPLRGSYLILIGINLETALMFAVFGLAVARMLRMPRETRVLGLPHRWAVVLGFSIFCAVVECVLNAWGALAWEYRYWSWPHVWTVMLFAYGPLSAFAVWIYDMKSMRLKARIVAGIYALDVVLFAIFVGWLKWA
jgi:hypothetical protein